MAIRPAVFALTALVCAACASQPQVVTRLVTQRVEVPVTVFPQPPAAALDCRARIPDPPRLRDAPGGVLIPEDQIPAFVDYVTGWVRCDAIWRAWATARRP